MEGSSLGRLPMDATFETEDDLEQRFAAEFEATPGLPLVYASAQNIDRVVTIFRAAKKTGRRMIIDLYAAAVLEATGRDSIPQSAWPQVSLFVPKWQVGKIIRNESFELLKHHSPNRILEEHLAPQAATSVLLFRSIHEPDLERAGALEGARLLYSQWEGYLKEDSGLRLKAWAEGHGIPFQQVHTSGHAGPADLKRYAEALDPRVLVPIHSFHPGRYLELFPRVELHGDGEWWEV